MDRSLMLHDTPIGTIGLIASRAGIRALRFSADRARIAAWLDAEGATPDEGNPILQEAARQLQQYLRGELKRFTVPVDLTGIAAFSTRVLKRLAEFPCGTVCTYAELAAMVGSPKAARAVGRAMAINPVPILIPCHRVLTAGNRLHAYSGGEGVVSKEALLAIEGVKLAELEG